MYKQRPQDKQRNKQRIKMKWAMMMMVATCCVVRGEESRCGVNFEKVPVRFAPKTIEFNQGVYAKSRRSTEPIPQLRVDGAGGPYRVVCSRPGGETLSAMTRWKCHGFTKKKEHRVAMHRVVVSWEGWDSKYDGNNIVGESWSAVVKMPPDYYRKPGLGESLLSGFLLLVMITVMGFLLSQCDCLDVLVALIGGLFGMFLFGAFSGDDDDVVDWCSGSSSPR